jgi:cytochrome c551
MRRKHVKATLALLAVCVVLVAVVLASCGSSSSTTTTTAAPQTSSSTTTSQTTGGAIDAAALYQANCSGCHSNVPTGEAAEVKTVIENGKESMPGFKDKLTADEIDALATWVANGGK